MKYYSIGTPVGCLSDSTSRYIYRDAQLISIDAAAFRVWSWFLHGVDYESVTANPRLMQYMPLSQLSILFQALLEAEMLVDEKSVLQHTPQRQGYGLGFSKKTKKCSILLNTTVEIDYPVFLVWSYCDGQTTCMDIKQRLPIEWSGTFTDEHLRISVDMLLKNNLLVFVS